MDSNRIKYTQFSELVDKYDNFIFDFDGTLWQGSISIPYAFEALSKLKDYQKNIFFITNTSSYTRSVYQQKLKNFGFDTIIEKIYGSAYITANYIKKNHPDIMKVYIVGMEGLLKEFITIGFEVVGGNHHNDKEMNATLFKELKIDNDIQAVVCGWDLDFNYYKLCYGSLCLQQGAKFFATNYDASDKLENRLMPAAGTMVASLEHGSEKKAIVIGKPNQFVIDLIEEEHKIDRSKTIIIGDRLDSDILLGINSKIDTLLVLTGVTTEDNIDKLIKQGSMGIPTYISKNLHIQIISYVF